MTTPLELTREIIGQVRASNLNRFEALAALEAARRAVAGPVLAEGPVPTAGELLVRSIIDCVDRDPVAPAGR